MSDLSSEKLIEIWDELPEPLKQKTLEYIERLVDTSKKIQGETSEEKIKRRLKGFGSWKGKIHIADDFDEPLDDFKEYMSSETSI
ncbi:DUF2281 domain-containing protein [Synechocystis salina]|uniref:DUF2281 domain-containing protein n=1 Tax=Synechocystis salina LEGE 00031 TaxID=1828736 RepID=A0ABR9VSU3_9SYNC|nr:DUF2281 domain-containing protein [Synechocystis salina]MBE9240950.1 DUF2281 domain-containing protein [Synechocystis salina LEGE 00041]MBE9254419.1 DUF2281 domain-containing protein [Synechocystis salina LEGE 00031]